MLTSYIYTENIYEQNFYIRYLGIGGITIPKQIPCNIIDNVLTQYNTPLQVNTVTVTHYLNYARSPPLTTPSLRSSCTPAALRTSAGRAHWRRASTRAPER